MYDFLCKMKNVNCRLNYFDFYIIYHGFNVTRSQCNAFNSYKNVVFDFARYLLYSEMSMGFLFYLNKMVQEKRRLRNFVIKLFNIDNLLCTVVWTYIYFCVSISRLTIFKWVVVCHYQYIKIQTDRDEKETCSKRILNERIRIDFS